MGALDLQTSVKIEDGNLVVKRTQYCVPIAEYAKAKQSAGDLGSSDFKHAASIPFVLIEDYCNRHNIEFSEFANNRDHIRAMLNDPALAHFRIWPGKV